EIPLGLFGVDVEMAGRPVLRRPRGGVVTKERFGERGLSCAVVGDDGDVTDGLGIEHEMASGARWPAHHSPGSLSRHGGAMRFAVVCSIAVAFPAAAQFTPTVEAPATSFALQDDGTSVAGNPAGYGFVEGLEADF